ncbi:MAG: DUF371 domain-containing protein [Candidatus Lokiarchaeota archaeon]|nr:DUF371 domain-containing protein [Candidatus Harpocratesius repetitus]
MIKINDGILKNSAKYSSEEVFNEIKPYILDKVVSYGHPNVQGTHSTTLEVTTEDFLTLRGTCIIGINATKSVADLSNDLQNLIQSGKEIGVFLKSGVHWDHFIGFGDSRLSLTNKVSIVFRKSTFLSSRTVLIACSKSAQDINRKLIKNLQNPSNHLEIYFHHIPSEMNLHGE